MTPARLIPIVALALVAGCGSSEVRSVPTASANVTHATAASVAARAPVPATRSAAEVAAPSPLAIGGSQMLEGTAPQVLVAGPAVVSAMSIATFDGRSVAALLYVQRQNERRLRTDAPAAKCEGALEEAISIAAGETLWVANLSDHRTTVTWSGTR